MYNVTLSIASLSGCCAFLFPSVPSSTVYTHDSLSWVTRNETRQKMSFNQVQTVHCVTFLSSSSSSLNCKFPVCHIHTLCRVLKSHLILSFFLSFFITHTLSLYLSFKVTDRLACVWKKCRPFFSFTCLVNLQVESPILPNGSSIFTLFRLRYILYYDYCATSPQTSLLFPLFLCTHRKMWVRKTVKKYHCASSLFYYRFIHLFSSLSFMLSVKCDDNRLCLSPLPRVRCKKVTHASNKSLQVAREKRKKRRRKKAFLYSTLLWSVAFHFHTYRRH